MTTALAMRRAGRWAAILFSLAVVGIGLALAPDGLKLLRLGGSPFYIAAAAGLIASGLLMTFRRSLGGILYGLIVLATLMWALWEAGLAFWPLAPRIVAPAVLGLGVLLALLALAKTRGRTIAMTLTGASVALSLAVMIVALIGQYGVGQAATAKAQAPIADEAVGDWRFYGRDPGGQRFSPAAQINAANVGKLKIAWQVRTGEIAMKGSEDQNTPSQIGDLVYVCTPLNKVIAYDADTGRERWRHDPKVRASFWNRCRGVGYHEAAVPANEPSGPDFCRRRIISTTIDARMFALDAETGARCPDFGTNGVVSLREGMGEIKPSFYFQTSAPTVAGDLVIVGGWVLDNRELVEPSGVVRAFSAVTGELVWAWDLGDPTITKLPPPGKSYTRGTPNVWSTPAFDPQLGLIYLPTGNATPDYWGSHRSDAAERYASSVVALDIATGRERWRYQTVHHDIWDYDVPSQPMLIDFPDGKGGSSPALVQLTKRGQIFVLDRRTGAPLIAVEERKVPGRPAPGEWVYPTQPYAVGMPALGAEPLTEAKMWGVTPFGALACRIAFRTYRYEGDFTPPGLTPSIQYPGNAGGSNWGSGSFDATRGYLITTDMRMPILVSLKRSEKPGVQMNLVPGRSEKGRNAVPYQSSNERFLSKVLVPCLQPPYGMMTAIDLSTRKIVWQTPVGSAENSAPNEGKSHLPIPLGTPTVGGSITTAGGLAFHGATTDGHLRAYDTGTGKVVWKHRLPVGAGGTPMTYVSPRTGKQYVVITASGARNMPDRGDYVVAFALPDAVR